jgi:hypothetical protein
MGLEDIKDQLREQALELRSRIEESAAYNSLRERYENLSPGGQKGLILGAVLFTAFMMMYIPYSYFSASSDYVVEYDDKRQLIRKLLQASRTASSTGAVGNPPAATALAETIRSRLSSFALLPDQTTSVSAIAGAELGGGFAPPGIEQEGVRVDLSSLNIKQVVDIGYDLQNLMQGVRLVGLSMNPNAKDSRYFDVSYKIARFSLPGVGESSGAAENEAPAPAPRPGGNRNRFQPNANDGAAPPPPQENVNEEPVEEEGEFQ